MVPTNVRLQNVGQMSVDISNFFIHRAESGLLVLSPHSRRQRRKLTSEIYQQLLSNAHRHFPRLTERLLLRNRRRRVIGSTRVVRRFVDSLAGEAMRLPARDAVAFMDCVVVVVVVVVPKASPPVDTATEGAVAATATELGAVEAD